MDDPPCSLCGHQFVEHYSNCCRSCACVGYRSTLPITLATISVGEEFRVARGYYAGVVRAVVIAVEAEAVVLRLEDGTERRVVREEIRTGRLTRG